MPHPDGEDEPGVSADDNAAFRIDHAGYQIPAGDDRQVGGSLVGHQQSVDHGVAERDRQRPVQGDAGPGGVEVGHGACDAPAARTRAFQNPARVGERADGQDDIGTELAMQVLRDVHGPGGQADPERRALTVRTRVRELGQGMGVITA
ncbi:MAG: hypothetical protein ACYCO9_09940 [Streptosporangiaceae bacterium]